jgi:trimethylamine:corrinoid methyltransferase-like protein
MWVPYVTDRDNYDRWVAGGAKDYAARAREYARQLLESHQPPAIDASVDGKLRQLGNVGRQN